MPPVAYLKTECEQCGGSIEYPSELAGSFTDCPHCNTQTNLPSPFTMPVSEPSESIAQDGDVFLSEGGILVTKTRFAVGAQTFALANISSVRGVENPPGRGLPILVLLFGTIFFLGAIPSFAEEVLFALAPLAIGLLLMGLAIYWMLKQKPTFSVVLTAAGGEVTAYTSRDGAFILRVIQAITDAIVARG
jgi:hypothetical protein